MPENKQLLRSLLCLLLVYVLLVYNTTCHIYNIRLRDIVLISVAAIGVTFSVFIYYKQRNNGNIIQLQVNANGNNYKLMFNHFDVESKYIESTINTYNTLNALLLETLSELYLVKLIAEYAATLSVKCSQCDDTFGFIECFLDYEEYNGSLMVCDEDGNIRYYLNVEQWRWFVSKPEDIFGECYADTDTMSVLCIPCGVQWKCEICELQALEWTHDSEFTPGGCSLCTKIICDDCSIYDKGSNSTLCYSCYEKQSSSDDENYDISKWHFQFD